MFTIPSQVLNLEIYYTEQIYCGGTIQQLPLSCCENVNVGKTWGEIVQLGKTVSVLLGTEH